MVWTYRAGSTGLADPVGRIEIPARGAMPAIAFGIDGSFRLRSAAGLFDTPDVRGNYSAIANADGDFSGSKFYGTRVIDLVVGLWPGPDDRTMGSFDDLRAQSDYLRSAISLAQGGTMTMFCQSAEWPGVRVCYAELAGPISFSPPLQTVSGAPWRSARIPLKAPDPYLYENLLRTVSLPYGAGVITIPNPGSQPTFFVARFNGQAYNPQLLDDSRGQGIRMTTVIGPGDYYTADTRNMDVIRHSDGVSLYGTITTYNLVEIPPGGTSMRALKDSGSGTDILLGYAARYV